MIDFSGCTFREVTFEEFNVRSCNFTNASFDDINIIMRDNKRNNQPSGVIFFSSNHISRSLQFPNVLIRYLESNSPQEVLPTFIEEYDKDKEAIFTNLIGLWHWVFKNRNISKKEFVKSFISTGEAKESQEEFYSFLNHFYDENASYR